MVLDLRRTNGSKRSKKKLMKTSKVTEEFTTFLELKTKKERLSKNNVSSARGNLLSSHEEETV